MPVSRLLIEALTLALAFACCPDAGFKAFSQAFGWAFAFARCPDAGLKASNESPYLGLRPCLLPRCRLLGC